MSWKRLMNRSIIINTDNCLELLDINQGYVYFRKIFHLSYGHNLKTIYFCIINHLNIFFMESIRFKKFELKVYEFNDNTIRISICDKDGSPLDVCWSSNLVETLRHLLHE